jgi:PhzF family phenazine biosynthesis protein
MASNVLLKKVTARVFTSPGGAGGNPVTVFLSKVPLAQSIQTRLAQDCQWESVVAEQAPVAGLPKLSFFLPSGEEVNFCSHAAMGAVHSIVRSDETRAAAKHSVKFDTAFESEDEQQLATVDEDDTVGLHMRSTFSETPIDNKAVIQDLLHLIQLDDSVLSNKWPSLSTCSVARPKTLLEISSLDALQSAQPPSDTTAWRQACDSLNSTGVYLYTHIGPEVDGTTYECRQFPRASGYLEDPATGTAAAALAVSLRKECDTNTFFSFHQGTAMGRPSRIKIQDVELHSGGKTATYSCWGGVSIDDEEMISVSS